MNDNLPKDLPDPNNPVNLHYHQVQSELASHRHRDAHGHFVSEHPNPQPDPAPQTSPTSQIPPNPSSPSNPPTRVIHGGGGGDSDDDNLAEFKLKNPFSRFFNFLTRFIKNQNVKISIPAFTMIGIVVAAGGGGGLVTGALIYFFPHNSPVFHREVVYQGSLQKTDKGFFLTLPNSDLYTLRPKAKSSINFQSLQDGPALVKGNLTVEKFVIDVTEVIPLGTISSSDTPIPQTSLTALDTPNSSAELPELYSSINWETTQTKVLTFTSGKRRIEQEGVYLESAKLDVFPYDFINYYITQLKGRGFKQTLNKIDPDGITTSFEKTGIFLTFGVKNVYSGSGDNKKITGYKAFIEHN